jgi:Tyrosine-protein kinase ephrin type A/B receptor-like
MIPCDCVPTVVAPPGSYYFKGAGKACPKGTYKEGYDLLSSCLQCPQGTTTAGPASPHRSHCDRKCKAWMRLIAIHHVRCMDAAMCPNPDDMPALWPPSMLREQFRAVCMAGCGRSDGQLPCMHLASTPGFVNGACEPHIQVLQVR